MLQPAPSDKARFKDDAGPWLLVTVDAEEEFDWTTFSSSAQNVTSLSAQGKAQDIFSRYNVHPTYFVDYPVVNQDAGYKPLAEFHAQGLCHIGAHLHPWVNPPLNEEISFHNSFPGNLEPDLEYEKLIRLTDVIEDRFGARPTSYRAGRYGVGPNTAAILDRLAYTTDFSVLPMTDLRKQEGPDFRACPSQPYWFGPGGRLLEIPMTIGFLGLLSPFGAALHSAFDKPLSEQFKLWAFLARTHILDRIKLSPEGVSLDEAKRLTRSLLNRGDKLFVVSYHSSSLVPGNTPYVTTQTDLDHFFAWLDDYLNFFTEEIGGTSVTPDFILEQASKSPQTEEKSTQVQSTLPEPTKIHVPDTPIRHPVS